MYDDEIKKFSPFTIADAIRIAEGLVPEHLRNNPWTILNHGRKVLSTEDELNCYMAAYGEMHRVKAFHAIDKFPFQQIGESVEIIDYGCGQGLASQCFVERMRERKCLHMLRKITMIEPSEAALHRAEINLRQTLKDKSNCEIVKILKYLPSSSPSDNEIKHLDINCPIVVHLFSNVLDIATIELKKTASLIASSGNKHYVLCFGPANCEEYRINAFIQYFSPGYINVFFRYREPIIWKIKEWQIVRLLGLLFLFYKNTRQTRSHPLLFLCAQTDVCCLQTR